MAKIHALNDDTFDAFDLKKRDFDILEIWFLIIATPQMHQIQNENAVSNNFDVQCYAQNESKIEFETYLHYRFPI